MAHRTPRSSYRDLTERLNRFPQGAPPSKLLYQILALLFSEREAELVAKLPIKPFTASKAARCWRLPMAEAKQVLDELASRAILVDIDCDGTTEYVLPPPMAGFFEFALMRVRDDLDQKLLSELYEQYISVEEEFIRALFTDGKTQLGRTFVHEDMLGPVHTLHVLDHERATQVVETASEIGVGLCYCRHKEKHLGRNCAAPLDNCLTFNTVASSLVRHGHARRIDKAEGLELLAQAREANLVQFGENIQNGVNFICNCCPCCCEAMRTQQRFGSLHPIHTSNYLAIVGPNCSGCGRCLPTCPARIISLETTAKNGLGPKRAKIDIGLCLGCGVCVRNCPVEALELEPRPQRVLTPVNSVHRNVLMAIERGKLQELIYDNQVLWSHRALAALLGAVLKLPPVKRLLAGEQIGSRYLARLCERYDAG